MNSTLFRQVLAFALLALPAAAQNLELNAPLAREVSGWIGGPASPDGKTLVYQADRDGGPASELYALASDGQGGTRRLSGAIEDNGYHASVQFTQDGQGVLFLEDLDANGSVELALVPIDGSAPPGALSGTLVPGGNVQSFQVSRDGLHVLYLADQVADEVFELFSVPVAGGAGAVKLDGSLAPGGDVQALVLSDDGQLVCYLADQDTDEVMELFVAPVDGSSPARKLPIPLVAGGDVLASFQFDPDGSHVLYAADQQQDERIELFTVPIGGGQPPLKLNGPLVPGGDVGVSNGGFFIGFFSSYFVLSPNGRWVVYGADQDTDERFELYSVPADGSLAPVKLSTPSDHEPVLQGLSYDSAWAIYQSDPSGTDTSEIFSVPIDGSAPSRRISGPMASGGDAYFPQSSFDSRRVVYAADQDVDQVYELYSAPIDGSALPVKLNKPLPPGGGLALEPANLIPGFYVMEGGVMYEADQEVVGLNEIYFAPIAGGTAAHKLVSGPSLGAYPAYTDQRSPPADFARVYFWRERALFSVGVEPGAQPILLDEAKSSLAVGDVGDFLLSASGERAVYRAREAGDAELGELYSVRTVEPREHVRLRSGLPAGRFSSAHYFTRDERRVIYSSRTPANSQDLYIEPVDGSAPPVQLNSLPAGGVIGGAGGEFDGVVLLPDGERLAFLASVGVPAHVGLFTTLVDGSSPPQLLSGGLDLLQGLEVSADGSRIAFRSSESPLRLYVVPSDGSAPPRRVENPPGFPSSDFRLGQDGQRVFFRASTGAGRIDLFMAPSDASAAPLRLNASLPAGGAVTAFALDPLGLRVVYRADQEFDGRFELYGVPADGSAAAVRLHAPLSGGLDVRDFQIASDAARVVFLGDLHTDEVFELFAAPLDASRAPVRLSGNQVAGGDVLDYRISPDGKRVVYRADQESDGVLELFSTSIGGSRGQARLSRPLVPGGFVGSFQISSDSRTVAFTAQRLVIPPPSEHEPGPPLTLLTAPIRGQEKASEVAGPLQGLATVTDFQISSDGHVVVYRADQDEPGAIELYAARRAPAPVLRRAAQR